MKRSKREKMMNELRAVIADEAGAVVARELARDAAHRAACVPMGMREAMAPAEPKPITRSARIQIDTPDDESHLDIRIDLTSIGFVDAQDIMRRVLRGLAARHE